MAGNKTYLEPEVEELIKKFEESKFPLQLYNLENGCAAFNLVDAASKNPGLAFNLDLIKKRKLIVYDPIIGREQKRIEEAFDDFRVYLKEKGILFTVARSHGISDYFSCRPLLPKA